MKRLSNTAQRRVLRRLRNLKFYPASSDPERIAQELVEIILGSHEGMQREQAKQARKDTHRVDPVQADKGRGYYLR